MVTTSGRAWWADRASASLVGAERHPAVDLPLRFLGLGEPDVVPVDERGRIRADALGEALALATGPTIVSLQAGQHPLR